MMNIKTKTTLIIILTLIIGIAVGAFLNRAFIQHRIKKVFSRMDPKHMVSFYEHIIQPEEKQSKQLRHILDEYAKRIAEIRKSTQEQLRITNEFFMEEMDRLLTPEQKKRMRESRGFGRWGGRMPRQFGGPPRIIKSINLEVKWLNNQLSLSREQVFKIRNVLIRFHTRPINQRNEMWRTNRKEREFMVIQDFLNEKQKKIFQKIKQDWQKKREEIYLRRQK